MFHANATTFLVVALLLSSERLKSFSLFMLVGIGASLLTILITREVLPRSYGWIPDLGRDALGWLRRSRVGLFRARKIFAALLVGGLVLSGAAMLKGGAALELGPDFRPGTQLVVLPESDATLRDALDSLGERLPDVGIRHQTLGPPEQGRHLVTVGTAVAQGLGVPIPGDDAPTTGELFSIFASDSVDVESLSSIDDKVSGRRLLTGMSVLLLSFFFLAVYLVLLQEPLNRLFSPSRGPSSPRGTRALIFVGIMLAIVLDVSVMLATISWLHIPVGLPVVAGILTVIGYSVNDSVVLWCHIQTRQPGLQRENEVSTPLSHVTGAIDRITSRAVLTTATTLLPALTILAVGLTPLADFAWVVIVGTVTGTLSSIFVVGSFALRALEREKSAGAFPA